MPSAMRSKIGMLTIPAGLVLVLALTFGPLISQLGFYWDDWPVILTGRLLGAEGFIQFYQHDRPISAWTYIVTFPILGSTPLHWQVFTLALRAAAAVMMWATLANLWPRQRAQTATAAFLFAIYPVFIQQPIAVAYSQHWICYLLYFSSLATMVLAWRNPRWFWPLTLLAAAMSQLQLLTMEYFAGLELLRPVLLWVLASETGRYWKDRLRSVLLAWLPYLIVLAGFVIWRLFFLEFPGEEANDPVLLRQLLTSPVSAGLRLLESALQDTLFMMFSAWARAVEPASIQLLDRFNLFSWGFGALIGLFAAWFLHRFAQNGPTLPNESALWWRHACIIGLVAVLFGSLPAWLTDRQIISGRYSDRFGLAGMFGAALLMAGLLEGLIAKKLHRLALIGVLIASAAGMHLRIANDFQWSWILQNRFYWQLNWRAPSVQPGTAFYSEGELFQYVGLYSTSSGLNLLYPPSADKNQLPFWFFSLGREFGHMMPEFSGGMPLDVHFRNYQFQGNSHDGLTIHYTTEHDCLEILGPEDANAPGIPPLTAIALQYSDLKRIISAK
jgi:hypothetical protein